LTCECLESSPFLNCTNHDHWLGTNSTHRNRCPNKCIYLGFSIATPLQVDAKPMSVIFFTCSGRGNTFVRTLAIRSGSQQLSLFKMPFWEIIHAPTAILSWCPWPVYGIVCCGPLQSILVLGELVPIGQIQVFRRHSSPNTPQPQPLNP
jgi:hypothetical protein